MIAFESFRLDNGLKVIVHEDPSTPMAVLNVLYQVGARDEAPDKTGFAHLFEHLMFEGSRHIPQYDEPLQQAGGENNAFTNNDYTNYYNVVPAQNLETAFWLESDRMLDLAFSESSLDIQKKVVSEEFKENYLNQPYGDIWHYLRELCYTVHPYRWPTIGLNLDHIEKITLADVKAFYTSYYHPANAILAVAGKVSAPQVRELAEKWFGDIPTGPVVNRQLPREPEQLKARSLTVEKEVPVDLIMKAFHMSDRLDDTYYHADMLSDILSGGKSSRLYQALVKDEKLFSEVDAYISGSLNEGLFVIEGKLAEGVSMQQADEAIHREVDQLMERQVGERELEKVKNKIESYWRFSHCNTLSNTIQLAYWEMLGDADMVNREIDRYLQLDSRDLMETANHMFHSRNLSTLYYHAKN